MDNELLKAAADKGPFWSLIGIGAAWSFSLVKRWLGLEKEAAQNDTLEQARGMFEAVKDEVAGLESRVNAVEKMQNTDRERMDRIEKKIDDGFDGLRNLIINHIEKR